MPQVLNKHPHASEKINGVAFTRTKNGMISEEISQEQADYFMKIPGYVAVKPSATTAKAASTPPSDPPAPSSEQQSGQTDEQAANEAASKANVANEATEDAKK